MSEFDAVIFDYGNVLSQEQSPALLRAMAERLNCDVSDLEHYYWHFRPPYDCGKLDGRQYWYSIGEGLGQTIAVADADQLITIDNRSWSQPNSRIVGWAHALKEHGVKIAILSNMPIEFRQELHINCSWLPDFDQRTYSCELGIMKPDLKIYEYCLHELGVKPERSLFLDDRLPNIEAAQKLGIQGLHFLRTEDAVLELEAAFGWEAYEMPVKTM
jgi:putative hydrolase of the HAD superfamily